MQINPNSRPVTGVIVGSSAAIAMALGHHPVIWVVIAAVGGFIAGCLTAKWMPNA